MSNQKGHFVFFLQKKEETLFLNLLARYPVMPADYHARLTSNDSREQEREQLLGEALAEQKLSQKKALKSLLQRPGCMVKQKDGTRMQLTPAERECVLQVLNDIRVGSWIRLGCPDNTEEPSITDENAEDYWAMDLCGYFQMGFLNPDS